MVVAYRPGETGALRAAPGSMAEASVVELRQYRLVPGGLGTLLDLFETYFVSGQEASGIHVGAILLDPDDECRFTWMRGFHEMEQRREALETFYYGPVWQRHRAVANPTLEDNDDVLLLRPTDPPHPPAGPGRQEPGEVVHLAVVVHGGGTSFESWMAETVHPLLERHLGTGIAMWRTEPAVNTFESLPVRVDRAVVWSATFPDLAAHGRAIAALESADDWTLDVCPRLERETTAVQHQMSRPTRLSRHASPRVEGVGP
jgi:hypothetical protein